MSSTTQKKAGDNVKTMPAKAFQIPRGDVETMVHAHNVWAVEIPEAMPLSVLEDPKTWGLAAQKGFKVKDRVEVMAKNGSQLAKGIVTFVRGSDIRVQFYANYEMHAQKENEVEYQGFRIKFVSNKEQWCIFDGTTGHMLKGNQPSSAAAIKYLDGHFRSLGTATA